MSTIHGRHGSVLQTLTHWGSPSLLATKQISLVVGFVTVRHHLHAHRQSQQMNASRKSRPRSVRSRCKCHFRNCCGYSMMSMSTNLKVESSLRGGVMGAGSRSLLRGETFFYLTISASQSAGEALLAPSTIGGIETLQLSGTEYFLQKGSFLAAQHSV
ncbi:MAG: AIM24 family protein, partial [Actinomycetota bacterium]